MKMNASRRIGANFCSALRARPQAIAALLFLSSLSVTVVEATSSPTPSPTIWWANKFLFFTYFELYFIGTAILIGVFLVCFMLCALFQQKALDGKHICEFFISTYENFSRVRAKRMDERFRESKSLLGKAPRSNDQV